MITASSPAPEVQRQATPRPLSPAHMVLIGLCTAVAGSVGAAIISKGIANTANFNANYESSIK